MNDFCRQMGAGQEVTLDDKWVGGGKVTFLLGVGGVRQADDLSGAEQLIPDWLV